MKKRLAIALAVVLLVTAASFAYLLTGTYKANGADAYLQSDETVAVCAIKEGWLFDGPGRDDALIFYPGAKVEPAAYAPLLRNLAERGVDSFLVQMPLNFAIFGVNRADRLLQAYSYGRWFLAGHSLGGAMAAQYASSHAQTLSGLFLLGAYTASDLTAASFPVVYLYGSQDGVLNRDKLEKGLVKSPSGAVSVELDGGNHAQFGLYGPQKGDGEATISAEAQQTAAADEMMRVIDPAKEASA